MNSPMHYRLRRFELIPTVMALTATLLMVGLGVWQLQRLEWKESLIARIEEGNRTDPLTSLPMTEGELETLEFRKVELTGRFIGKEMQITPRYRGAKLGYGLVQPFALARGGTVLVDRGWVPVDKKELGTRPETVAPKGKVTLKGVVRGVGRHNAATPDNQPAKNLWFWYDVPAMEQALGLTLLPAVIHQTAALSDAELPVPSEETITLRNDHLGYAITWFLVALSGAVIFFVYHLEKRAP